MCGRYVAASSAALLAEYFEVDDVTAEPEPSWNVAPTDPVPAVVDRDGRRRLGMLGWGLVPSWAKDRRGAAKLINARAETIAAKPAFRAAFARRRCLLPADGFYEWQRRPGPTKQAWFIHRADGAPLAMAGLWEFWRPPDQAEAEPLRTAAVVTTRANEVMTPIHDRMPVLLQPDTWAMWLDTKVDDLDALEALLVPADPRLIDRYRVPPTVNNVRNNGPSLLDDDPAPDSLGQR